MFSRALLNLRACTLAILFLASSLIPYQSLAYLHFEDLAFIDSDFTILHTSDLHSHFTSRQSLRGLGGYARIKTKVDQIRSHNPSALLLDSGDWSEGTIFFTMNSGEASQKLLDYMGYDALVMGNHDWLVGPEEMYNAFKAASMRSQVITSNFNFEKLPPHIPLEDYIKPYVIRHINGFKIGVFGLSTEEIIFEHFIKPVKIVDPIKAAKKMVDHLRHSEGCDVVIALTHLGIQKDRELAKKVKGLDAIIGGHSHTLLKEPEQVNDVLIFHVGQWGEYLGEYQFKLDSNKKLQVVSHKLHQIDPTIQEDERAKAMIEGYKNEIEHSFGSNIFSDNIFYSDVDLKVLRDSFTNDTLGNLAVDALREKTQTDIAVDSPLFSSSSLIRGWSHSADLFNLFPHIYTTRKKDSWNIYTYRVSGYILRLLLSFAFRFGLPIKLSNAELVIDLKANDPIQSFKINGKNISPYKTYSVSSTPGILDFFRELRNKNIPIGPSEWHDTGIVAWRAIANKLKAASPFKATELRWTPRIRSRRPDYHIAPEMVRIYESHDFVTIDFDVINAGLEDAELPTVWVAVDRTPANSLDDSWTFLKAEPQRKLENLGSGQKQTYRAVWQAPEAKNRVFKYPIRIQVNAAKDEQVFTNNIVETTTIETLFFQRP